MGIEQKWGNGNSTGMGKMGIIEKWEPGVWIPGEQKEIWNNIKTRGNLE